MLKEVSDFVGDCVSIFYGEHTQSLRFQQHCVHHRHKSQRKHGHTFRSSGHIYTFASIGFCSTLMFPVGSWYVELADTPEIPSS